MKSGHSLLDLRITEFHREYRRNNETTCHHELKNKNMMRIAGLLTHFSNIVATLNAFTFTVLTVYLSGKVYTALFDFLIRMPFVLKS